MIENIFEKALRLKIRFEHKGQIGVEDLWDLSLESLNSIYKGLSSQKKEVEEEGLLNTRKNSEQSILELKLEVVKSVFESKKMELDERKKKAENKQKKDRLQEILAQRKNKELLDTPSEDIQKMIDELGE